MTKVQAQVVKRFTVPGSIDGHDAVGATVRFTGGDRPFRVTFVTVNWGRGYRPGELRRNVERLLDRVGELQYVVLLIQELDEDDEAPEHRVLRQELAELSRGRWSVVGWHTREPIAVSPPVLVSRRRRRRLMGSGLAIGAPAGTGPTRWLNSCVIELHGLRIGVANQHPHRDLPHPRVQEARRDGEAVTRSEVLELLGDGPGEGRCDVAVWGGDMNDRDYPRLVRGERVLHEVGLDTLRMAVAA